ncbi:outer membrane beta-barrel family protein [uncultured Acetobacteroides sp.]|uniref:outer membrane beta-barrel family protein n=1 Tax=uncultured Acetobacteroides sp. TaxID=1760811 RepID=UPI0029F49104|nr:outer membrane beta-barrel family protein [uncultured Acetobacteroides sp.]
MCRFFFVFLLLAGAFPLRTFGDSVSTLISGKVVDSLSRKGVPFVTVTVQDSQSKVLKRLAADASGAFEFSLKENLRGEVVISAVGYKPVTVKFLAGAKAKENLGSITMSELSTKIDQVVVQAQKQLVKIDVDKISYNTDADPESQTLTALDMMRKVPLLTVDGEDNIKLKGASSYKILVNGKESALMSANAKDVLKAMPASSIRSIEVITNPSSKYSAEGIGGIINIITSKKGLSGFSGSLLFRLDNLDGYMRHLYATATLGKFAFSMNYGHGCWRFPASQSHSTLSNFGSEDYRLTVGEGSAKRHGAADYLSGEFSYEIDSLNLISASFICYKSVWKIDSYSSTAAYSATSGLTQRFTTDSYAKNDWASITGNVDYQRSYRKPDKLLTISYKFDYTPQEASYTNDITGDISYGSSLTRSKNTAGSYENTFQLDFVNPINKNSLYEAGVKYILRTNPSDVSCYTYSTTAKEWEPNPSRSNDLSYTQSIAAGYLGYLLKLKTISVKAGLRLEGAYTDASFKQVADTSFSNRQTDLIPYASVAYHLSEASSIRISYTQRLQRPGIEYLNPYIDDKNPKYISYGYPNLKAEKVNSVDCGYSYFTGKLKFDFSLYARQSSSAIQTLIFTLPTGVQVQTYRNRGRSSTYGASFYGSVTPSAKLSISLVPSVEYNTYRSGSSGEKMESSGWTKSISGSFRWCFAKGFTLSGFGEYGNGSMELQARWSSYTYHGFTLSRDFLDRKFNAAISVQNPFKRYYTSRRYAEGATFSSVSENRREARVLQLAISYRFGKMGQAVKKAQRGISNDDVKPSSSKDRNEGAGR